MDTVTETTTTTTHLESTPSGVVETTKVEHEYSPDLGHHCRCPECLEWEEDVAHEIATLRERLDELEDGSGEPSSTSDLPEKVPEPEAKVTEVKTTPEVKEEESKTEDTPKQSKEESKEESSAPKAAPTPKKRHAGVIW